ncbi:MAG TPA: FKBP-type peptidyl-prolyl cis-trans isomerase [Rhodanobacteraceae bacterium]|nr:FKBP-type peptidyl-prolyl cis-trans isomerase [Rhodanobacteraceae bacterium]
MSRIVMVVLLAAGGLLPVGAFAAQTGKPAAPAPSTPASRAELSYALGYEAGLDLGQRKLDVDIATVLRGVQDGYARKQPQYSPEAMQQVMQAMRHRLIAQARAAFERMAAANLKRAHEFFAENGKKQGVVTLPSGVQYKVLDRARGTENPTLASEVTLQFSGQFLDGTVFANTKDLGKPVVFPVDGMIPGWRDIITRMHVGDHWQVFIPPDQGYGIRGEPPRIGPNEALIFDIRLLGIKP